MSNFIVVTGCMAHYRQWCRKGGIPENAQWIMFAASDGMRFPEGWELVVTPTAKLHRSYVPIMRTLESQGYKLPSRWQFSLRRSENFPNVTTRSGKIVHVSTAFGAAECRYIKGIVYTADDVNCPKCVRDE